MRRLARLTLLVLVLLPAGAAHGSGASVIKDCADDGQLSKRYQQAEYREALKDLPTDVDEYTDCRDIIRDARLSTAGKRDSGGSGGGASSGGPSSGGSSGPDASSGAGGLAVDPLKDASPAERAAVASAAEGRTPVTVGGRTITPGALADGSGGDAGLPGPVVAVLVVLAIGTAAAAAALTRRLTRPTA